MIGRLSGAFGKFGDAFSETLPLFIKNLAAKFMREYYGGGGNLNAYQPFVYPPQLSLYGTAAQMNIPIYANLSTQEKRLLDWDVDVSISNTTAQYFPTNTTDLNGVVYYPSPLDLHGHIDLVVWNPTGRNPPPITDYGPNLEGLMGAQTLQFTNDIILTWLRLSEINERIVWTWPFLVKPAGRFHEDTTRQYGIHVIKMPPGTLLYMILKASTIFHLPENGNIIPAWYSPFNGINRVVLNLLIFMCATITEGEIETAKITPAGNPMKTMNGEVVQELPTDTGTSNT